MRPFHDGTAGDTGDGTADDTGDDTGGGMGGGMGGDTDRGGRFSSVGAIYKKESDPFRGRSSSSRFSTDYVT
jgi:hypothetical protein